MDASITLVNVNETANSFYLKKEHYDFDIMVILQNLIASVGIVANCTVVVAFLNHERFRRKIPNMFIINQVGGEINTLQIIDLDEIIIYCWDFPLKLLEYCFGNTFY